MSSEEDPNDRDWDGNLVAQYHYYLREAFAASDAVDDFDLNSEDAASLRQWGLLRAESLQSSLKLIDFIAANIDTLKIQLHRNEKNNG